MCAWPGSAATQWKQYGDHRAGPYVVPDVAVDRGMDRSDEHVALSMDGLDDLLLAACVAQGPAQFLDLRRQRRFAHETITPHPVEQLVLGDDLVPVLEQSDENGQRPRLDRDASAISAQFPAIDVEFAVSEAQDHPATVLPARVATIPVAPSIS